MTLLGLPATSLVAALLASLLCGFVGTFVVLRRLVALGGGIAHAAFGGIGFAVVAGFDPRLGAAAVALLAAALLSRLPRERSDRQDALIGVLWAVGMAVGMLLLSRAGGGADDADVESYLFGDIARVRGADLWTLAAVVVAVVAVHLARGRELVATAFDPEHAAIQGLPVRGLSVLLMSLVALSVVALLQHVGVVLAIALLAVPPLVALRLCRSMGAIVACGAIVAFVIQVVGLKLALGAGWPAGPSIVLVGAAALALARWAPLPGRRAATALFLALCASSAGASSGGEATAERVAGSFELIGMATLPPNRFGDAPVGGLSGLTYDERAAALFALSDDRGGEHESRIFRLAIDLSDGRLEEGDVSVIGRVFLRDADREPFEAGRLDPEGISLDPNGGFFVATEGVASRGIGPSVHSFSPDGVERFRFALPPRYEPDAEGRERGVRDNLGFESLTVTPDGAWLVAGLENSLHGDGPAADFDHPSFARWAFWSLPGEAGALPRRELVYRLAPLSLPPGELEGYRVNGLSEILALSPTRFLALEREYVAGSGLRVRLVLVSTAGATDVVGLERVDPARVVPMKTTQLLDFAELGVPLDNYEAVGFGPRLRDGRRSLLIVSDDNFDPNAQKTIVLAFAIDDTPLTIAELQGRAHRSPLEGRWVAGVEGVVTAIDRRSRAPGFAIESTSPDGDAATSEAIWVAMTPASELAPGVHVLVTGRIEERAANAKQLPVTTLVASAVEIVAAAEGRAIPAPVALGSGALTPAQVDGDALAEFLPERDAIDFWESLESMRVVLPAAIATGPTLSFGEATLVSDEEGGEERSDAGGRLLFPGGPELDRWIVGGRFLERFPDVSVGARIAGGAVGVIDYSFSNYKVQLLAPPTVTAQGYACDAKASLRAEGDRLTVATLNVENLSAAGPPERFERFGRAIVERLASPSILALEEIQDDTGPARGDGVVGAERTLSALIDAIERHGGPLYRAISIDPELDKEGGQPGGNIRVVLLVDPRRVGVPKRGTAGSLTAATVVGMENTLRLEPNPGRVAPASSAFTLATGEGVRRSLAVELEVGGRPLFVVANHWSSKWDDDRSFGATQPPNRPTSAKRLAQALVVREFVERILAGDPQARVVVLGDLNDLPWSEPVERLSAPPMLNLLARVPAASRYTYNFEGSSQAIDYIVVSRSLAASAEAEVVHLNSNCPESLRVSDHDPVVASLRIRRER